MSAFKVAIVGGGIGGMVLAIALRERGISFELYERAHEVREVGAGVGLSANGTRELRRLGVGEHLEAASVIPSALVIRRWDTGEIIVDHPIGRAGVYAATFGAPWYGVHRVAFHQALTQRLAGEGMNLGRRCVDVDEQGSGVELHFADGGSAVADLAVGADGVRSALRPHVVGEVRYRFSGTVGYRGLVAVEAVPSLPDPTPLQFWAGPGRHLLHYAIEGGRVLNFLAVVRAAEWTKAAWMEECPVTDAVDAFAGWYPAVTEMVGATTVGARWALHDLAPLRRWHTERIVLIGDAAHAMVPHQGQGANQTIEDAIALADCLADAELAGELPAALRHYEQLRRARTIVVQWLSRRTADLMHLADGPEIASRDAAFRDLYSSLAWIHSYDTQARHTAQRSAPGTAHN
ncbi:MAG: FAD-dependent monooxygenase [Solirubrobacterales bacterium]|nr:FAD-dependent monooxygenase [Solirubrobacterales bacterium]